MKNIIQGGTPTSFNDLLKWTYEQAKYEIDILSNTGFYRIKDGYISQTLYSSILEDESLNIRCSYKSITKHKNIGTMYVNISYEDESTDVVLIPLEYNEINQNKTTWRSIEQDYKTSKDKTVSYIEVRIVSSKGVSLDVTELAIYYSGSDGANNGYNNNEFQDKCILYGFDKDKPKLRWYYVNSKNNTKWG